MAGFQAVAASHDDKNAAEIITWLSRLDDFPFRHATAGIPGR